MGRRTAGKRALVALDRRASCVSFRYDNRNLTAKTLIVRMVHMVVKSVTGEGADPRFLANTRGGGRGYVGECQVFNLEAQLLNPEPRILESVI